MNNINLQSPTGPDHAPGAAGRSTGTKTEAPSSAFADLLDSPSPKDRVKASENKTKDEAAIEEKTLAGEMMLAANENAAPEQNATALPSMLFLTLAQQGAGKEIMMQADTAGEISAPSENIDPLQSMMASMADAEKTTSLAQADELQADAGSQTSGATAKTETGNAKTSSLANNGFAKINSQASGLSSGSESDLDQGQEHSGEQNNSAAAVTGRENSDAPKSANQLAAQMSDLLQGSKQNAAAAQSPADPATLANTLAGSTAGMEQMARPTTGMEALGTTQQTGALPQSGAQLPQVPVNNLAVHIASQAHAGHHKFEIRLDPAELGKIDIRLEISRDGQALTHIAVEKPETLDLLRQDARALERALTGAGLDSREGGLSFSLREDNRGRGGSDMDEHNDQDGSAPQVNDSDELQKSEVTRMISAASGVDISI